VRVNVARERLQPVLLIDPLLEVQDVLVEPAELGWLNDRTDGVMRGAMGPVTHMLAADELWIVGLSVVDSLHTRSWGVGGAKPSYRLRQRGLS